MPKEIAQADADIEALKVQSEEATSPETKAIIDQQIQEQTAKKDELSALIPIETRNQQSYDKENKQQQIPSEIGVGQEPIQTEPNQEGGSFTPETSGILQESPQEEVKVEKTPEQLKAEQSDNLVAMKARYNSIRGNATAKKAALRQEISAKAKELGATIQLDPKSGKMEILNEKGKKLIRSKQENTAKPLEERSSEFQSFYEKIKGDLKLSDTSINNHKIDVGLSQKKLIKRLMILIKASII